MPGTLYIVATPIGNLADITLRALSTLKEVDLIAAEDTRVTHKLLAHYGIEKPMTSYHRHSLQHKVDQLLEALKDGKNVAVVSDAGTPGISDPGADIIEQAIANDIRVEAIPGPNAVIVALIVSGLSTLRFTFDGFPPRKPSDRRQFLASLKDEQRTMTFYESPMRLLGTLKDILTVLGDRRIAVVREATKMFEEVHRGTVSSAIERFASVAPRGEITIVLEGSTEEKVEALPEEQIEAALKELLASGVSERDAVRQVAASFPVPKKEIYRRMLDIKEGAGDD